MGAARQRETWYPAMHLHAPASSGSPSASFAGDEKPLRMAAVGVAAHFPPAPPGNQPRTPASGEKVVYHQYEVFQTLLFTRNMLGDGESISILKEA